MQTKEHLFSLLQDHQATLRRFGVQRCGVFGSFVRHAPTPHSDVDLLVEFAPEQKTFDHFMQLVWFLEDLLGRSVDLVTPDP